MLLSSSTRATTAKDYASNSGVVVTSNRGNLLPGPRTILAITDSSQNELPRLLHILFGAHHLDRLTDILSGHVDGTAALLADAVDLASALANNMAVRARVGQHQIAGDVVLSLGNGRRDEGLGFLDVLGGTLENPRNLAIFIRSACHDVP